MLKAKYKLIGKINSKSKLKGKLNNAIKYVYPDLKDLEIEPSKEAQVFNHKDFYGYDKVTVNAIPDNYIEPTGTLEITTNGEHDVTSYKKVMGNIHEITPYAPRCIRFDNFSGTELDYETANLDTSNMTSLTYAFNGCKHITSLNLLHWNTSNVTSLYMTWCNCNALERLDLSTWVLDKVTDTRYMLMYCRKLKYLDIRNFDLTKITSWSYMFDSVPTDCEIIVKDDNSKTWITSKFTTLTNVKTVEELEGVA